VSVGSCESRRADAKDEQPALDREANAFYDNIGRWAAKNGMVGVTVQRHPGMGNWDDGGPDISMAVNYAKANAAKFHGNPDRIFIWAHSAGNGPTGVYVGHPERWKNGVQVKGAIFMSGNPVPGVSGPAAGGDGRGAARAGGAPAAGGGAGRGALVFDSTCGAGAPGAADGAIAGPGAQTPAAPRGAGPGGPGGIGGPGAGAGRAGGQALTPEQQTERDNLPGFKMTATKILLARAEWDPGVMGGIGHSPARRTVQAGRSQGQGWCGSLPRHVVLEGREPHVGGLFNRHAGQDRVRTGPRFHQEREVARLRGYPLEPICRQSI
jgi:hypothetical protein